MITFKDVEELLHQHSADRIIPGLERISRLLIRLGNPQDTFKAVHIVGTNGKGSTGTYISSVLRASGYCTAFYSSPHLVDMGERLLIDGAPLSPDEWYTAAEEAIGAIHDGEDLPSYFEVMTAAAFVLMRRHRVEAGVIEAGLGGRLDATNTLHNVVCTVITSLSIDHTAYLGPTLEAIAAEKFAVIRPGTPAVFSGSPAKLVPMFREVCAARNAPCYAAADAQIKNVEVSRTGNRLDFSQNGLTVNGVRTCMLGRYQVDNAALALSAISVISAGGAGKGAFAGITEAGITEGMGGAKLGGRMEVIMGSPVVVLDGGHNAEGVRVMCDAVNELWGSERKCVVYGAMRDKEAGVCLSLLSGRLRPEKLAVVRVPDAGRSLRAEELAALSRKYEWRNEPLCYADPMCALRNS